MKKYKSNPICIKVGAALVYLTCLLAPRLIAIADGDTLTVLHDKTPVKIRLQGIDAPEKAQPFGEKAKQFTSSLVFGKEVRVEVVTRDRYGRTVGRVYTVNPPACLEDELVKAGLAWWYKQYAPKDKKLGDLEADAKRAKRGLWADPSPTPPWEWRHGKKDGPKSSPPLEFACRQDADCVLDYCTQCTDGPPAGQTKFHLAVVSSLMTRYPRGEPGGGNRERPGRAQGRRVRDQ
jgi:micrococcal nuclease